MALLWAVGPVALLVGVVLAAVWHRRVGAAADDLGAAVTRLGELRRSVQEVRALGGELASRAGRPRER